MSFDPETASEAKIAAALLALGIQRKNTISDADFARVLSYVTDSLHKMGVYVDIDDLNRIDKVPADQGVSIVTTIKTKLINGIGSSCDTATATLFELAFNFYLVVTTPEIIPNTEPELKRLGGKVGLEDRAFSEILETAKGDSETAIRRFEEAVDDLVGASVGPPRNDWLETFEVKPGVGGVAFDVKKAVELATKWIRARRRR